MVTLPAFADLHVHLREPGQTWKETIRSGSLAAARGGYSLVCAMPNLDPVPDCPEHLAVEEAAIARDAVVRVLPYGAITRGRQGKELVDFAALKGRCVAFSDDGSGVQRREMMREAMQEAARQDVILAAHCEDNSLLRGGYIHDGRYCAAHGHKGICSESEWGQIARDVELAAETGCCVGTSNVYLAMKYHLSPIGTYAHEFVQMYQGIDSIPLAYTNHYAMQDWYNEYKGDNGTALTDTITTDLFLLDFDRSMVNNYTGVRHDSGDPYEWGEKMIRHYRKYDVDPRTKLLLFSDSLDFDRAQALYDYFKEKSKVSFGIGTFCTNDTDEKALNIVIKLQYVNGRPVAKLSDAPGKAMCMDETYLDYLKRSVEFRLQREK